MFKELLFKENARVKILAGVTKLADAVRVTLGPKGKNVIIEQKFGSPIITKDGVTVAKEVTVSDPYENLGCQMVREVAEKTNGTSGDGTTTATILAEAVYKEGIKHITAGANAMELKSGIDKIGRAHV